MTATDSKATLAIGFTVSRNYVQWLLAALGTSGVIALFFPFACGYTVADGWEFLGLFILPVVAFPFLISIGFIVCLVAGRPLRWMNPAGYATAILVSAIALSLSSDTSFDDLLTVGPFTIIPAFCIVLGVFRNADGDPRAQGLVALQSLYAVHLSFYLLLFSPGLTTCSHQLGYWLAALALLSTFGQIATLAAKVWRAVVLIAPAAIMSYWVIAGLFS